MMPLEFGLLRHKVFCFNSHLHLPVSEVPFDAAIIKRMAFESRRGLPTPTGWLIHPERKRVLFFIRDPKSLMRMPKVITQLWYSTDEGIPTQIKNTRTMELEDANETWFELLSNGWKLVEHQINEDAA